MENENTVIKGLLVSLSLEKYIPNFEDHEITDNHLAKLSGDDIYYIVNKKIGPKMTIACALEQLKLLPNKEKDEAYEELRAKANSFLGPKIVNCISLSSLSSQKAGMVISRPPSSLAESDDTNASGSTTFYQFSQSSSVIPNTVSLPNRNIKKPPVAESLLPPLSLPTRVEVIENGFSPDFVIKQEKDGDCDCDCESSSKKLKLADESESDGGYVNVNGNDGGLQTSERIVPLPRKKLFNITNVNCIEDDDEDLERDKEMTNVEDHDIKDIVPITSPSLNCETTKTDDSREKPKPGSSSTPAKDQDQYKEKSIIDDIENYEVDSEGEGEELIISSDDDDDGDNQDDDESNNDKVNDKDTDKNNDEENKNADPNVNAEENDEGSDNEYDEYVVEKILKKRKRKGETQYLLKWKDYDVSESTWEPYEHLTSIDSRLLIDEFERSQTELRKARQKARSKTRNPLETKKLGPPVPVPPKTRPKPKPKNGRRRGRKNNSSENDD